MESQQILGTVSSWHKDRGFGIIAGRTNKQRFFLHISQLDESPDYVPTVGVKILFSEAPPRREGELPRAIDAKVFSPLVTAIAETEAVKS